MTIKNNIKKQPAEPHQVDENKAAIDEKLNELVVLLSKSDISSEMAKKIKHKLDQALNNAAHTHGPDEFSILLSNNQNNSKLIKQYLRSERASKFVLVAISLTMIILGLGMIIMPAPPFFEMFTIFYFNRNDGITIMDLISLLVVLIGVYFLIKGIYRNPGLKRLNNSKR